MHIEGHAYGFAETGSEGFVWVVIPEPLPTEGDSRSHFVALENGDKVTIMDHDGRVLFDGVIDQDRETGWTPDSSGFPGHGQPVALGFGVHWTQRGFVPDDWARMFLRFPPDVLFRAVVERPDL